MSSDVTKKSVDAAGASHIEPVALLTCLASGRPDNQHAWEYDGDDPYVVCGYCGERRDALTGRLVVPPPVPAVKRGNVRGALVILRDAVDEHPDEAVRNTRMIALRVLEGEIGLLTTQRDGYLARVDEMEAQLNGCRGRCHEDKEAL